MGAKAVLGGSTILITKEEIQNRVKQLAQQINFDYRGEEVVLIGILKGSFLFLSDLVKHLDLDILIDFVRAKSYEGEDSSGSVKISQQLSTNIRGKHVLIVEDILDTGLTLSNISVYLSIYDPLSVKIAVLLDKPSRRRAQIKADYVGFQVRNMFVYGYGLDYREKYRNLEDIHVLE